jgi:type IV pilus secretin PilQ/predicted competence protein
MDERLQQTITVEYKDADLVNVLRSLALTYRLNLITGPDIKGKVTINLQEITVEKALEAILKANGLNYSKTDGVIYISSGDASLVDVFTEVIQLKYMTATQAQNITREVLSSKGDMKINETANNIILTDYRENIEKIKNLLRQTDTAPKQVLIEAKILDITSSDLRSLGVTWNADYTPSKGGLFSRDTKFPEELSGTLNMAGTSTSLSGGQFVLNTLTLKGLTIGATIDALVRDGKAHLLASPSIAVINGQEARIVIGERFPYKERTQTTSGTTETTKFVDIGTSLKVNPQINDDGYITLSLHPEVSSLLSALDAGPRITTREADTTVRVKEGETLVIGGLIRQSDNRSEDKIPFLGNIPVLGHLFSRKEQDVQQTELAVFITPRILYSKEEQKARGLKLQDTENAYTLLDKTANLNIVEKIYSKAVALDEGTGIESVRKNVQFRKAEALSQYQLIYKQFPESERAPEAKYRMGLIQWQSLQDFKNAKNTFSTLIADYPRSVWAEEARNAYAQMDHELRQARVQAEDAMHALETTKPKTRSRR